MADGYWTPEKKAEHAERMRNYWKENGTEILKGRNLTDQQKERIRDGLREHYQTHSGPMTGKKHSEETKRELRRTMLRKWYPEEVVEAKMAEAEGK